MIIKHSDDTVELHFTAPELPSRDLRKVLDHSEQRELLDELALRLGFKLIDRVEDASLRDLANEVLMEPRDAPAALALAHAVRATIGEGVTS